MYNKNELSDKALIELIEIAKKLGISHASKFGAQELIYKILDHQAANPGEDDSQTEKTSTPKQRRTRLKRTPIAESTVKNPSIKASSQKAKELLGWQPKITDVKEIIASAWKWHNGHPQGYNID